MKAIRNFLIKWSLIMLAFGGFSVWFIHSQWLSQYEFVSNAKQWVKLTADNFYQDKKNQSIQWALNKANYRPASNLDVKQMQPSAENTNENKTKDVAKPASSVGVTPAQYTPVTSIDVSKASQENLPIIKIPYFYDTSREPQSISREGMMAILNKASEAWQNACGISFDFKGERMSDYVNVKNTLPGKEGLVRWSNLEGDAIGQAHQGSSRGPAQGFVLSLSPSYFAKQANQGFLYSTVLHEMGHVIGMGHNKNPDSIMFWQQLNRKQVLSETDKAMCKYYRARWSGMSAQAAEDKYKVLVNDNSNEDEEEVDD